MATMDMEYDQNRGNPPVKECLISLARSEDLCQATAMAWPWGDPADGDADYAVLPIAFFETLFRKAPVPDPSALQAVPFLNSCLHLHDYVEPKLQLLVAEDLLAEDDGGGGVYIFRDRTELQGYADAIIEGDSRLQFAVDDSAFDATDAGPLPGVPLAYGQPPAGGALGPARLPGCAPPTHGRWDGAVHGARRRDRGRRVAAARRLP